MWKRQQAVTGSRLSFRNGVLRWDPSGLSSKAPGSAPFQLKVGPSPGQVQELVWVSGTVAVGARGGSTIDAGAIAVCCPDTASPGRRRVLAYLPEALISLPSGTDPVPDPARARARGQEISDALGVPFSVHEVALGEDPNALFPGVMRHGRFGQVMAWLMSVLYLAGGIVFVVEGAYLAIQGQWPALFLCVLGIAFFALGAVCAPPLAKRVKQRYGKPTR